jgi:endonuclease G
VAFDKDYSNRKGFETAFLHGGKPAVCVLLPALSATLAKKAATLLKSPKEIVLHYRHYSVVMHKVRRFAIYSAANVDFNGRFPLVRPTDMWRIDPRIPAEFQVAEAFYTKNQFDRGHLTRREDQEYGTAESQAMDAAADTNHWTNCTPQHAKFNEGKQLWQGIERHILEDAVAQNNFRAQVITGPIFDDKDPVL